MSELNEASQRFMKAFGLQVPIIQAAMAGPATAPLVSAVANAGALGSLPLTFLSAHQAAERIEQVKARTSGAFLANFILNFTTRALDSAIAGGVQTILFSWGLPDAFTLAKLRKHSIKMGIQVADANNARRALELGPELLICQGIEAGGHVQGNKPLMAALEEVLAVAGDVPVAASGGIADGRAMKRYLDAGAAAAVVGTRFVATQESAAHPQYKQELVEASGPEQTVLTVCLNKLWPNATHRLLRTNETFQMWESAGRPPGPLQVADGPAPGSRPGEHDIVAISADGAALERYVDVVPVGSMPHVAVNALGTYAGEGVGAIEDIPPAAEVIDRLMQELHEA